MCLEAELRDLEQAITNYVIAPLIRWNYGDDASFPIRRFEPLSDVDKQKALDIWAALIVAATRPLSSLTNSVGCSRNGSLGNRRLDSRRGGKRLGRVRWGRGERCARTPSFNPSHCGSSALRSQTAARHPHAG